MPYSPSNESVQSASQGYYCRNPYESLGTGKLDRLEEMVERQQSEIDFLRAKLHEVSAASRSNMGTPTVPANGYHPAVITYPPQPNVSYPAYAPALPYNSPLAPPFVAAPHAGNYAPTLPPGAMRMRKHEMEARPCSAAPFIDRGFSEIDNNIRNRYCSSNRDDWSLNPAYLRPASAMDRWNDNEHDMGHHQRFYDSQRNSYNGNGSSESNGNRNDHYSYRNGFVKHSDFRFGCRSVENFDNLGQGLLPHPTSSYASSSCFSGTSHENQENRRHYGGSGSRNGGGRGGNFRGSGFRPGRGAGRGINGFSQARDSLNVLKDSGFPRSSSPSEDYSSFESDVRSSKFHPVRVTEGPTMFGNTLVPPQVRPRKLKGLVDDSFMSQQEEPSRKPGVSTSASGKVEGALVKPEPRPPSSILKEIVDDSFTSQTSLGNGVKSVTFKVDSEVAALGRRSPFHCGEITPSPTSSTSSSGNEAWNISSLVPADFTELGLSGQVVHAENPYDMYIVVAEYAELSEALASYGSDKKSPKIFDASRLREGELCIVQFTDNQWYRAAVTWPGKKPEVLLIDYGNTFTVPEPVCERMRAFDPSLTNFPVQGACAQLYGVVPPAKGDTTWPLVSTEQLKHLVSDVVVTVEIVNPEEIPPAVRIVRQDDDVDIAEALIEGAFARRASE